MPVKNTLETKTPKCFAKWLDLPPQPSLLPKGAKEFAPLHRRERSGEGGHDSGKSVNPPSLVLTDSIGVITMHAIEYAALTLKY